MKEPTKPIAEMTPAEQTAYCLDRFQEMVDGFRARGYSDRVIAMGARSALYRFARDRGFSVEAVDAMMDRLGTGAKAN